MKTTGKKEIAEAVIIASLAALATGFINFGIDEIKKVHASRQEAKKKAETDAKETEDERRDNQDRGNTGDPGYTRTGSDGRE